ncbi:hypothetical protein [Pseudomonas sp. NPDC096950]|uniref:hypothetical protein n=1 Tax=Pseudomonas sp. NPDC096950 TaxID=3364485 RepID=UPI00383A69A3
MKNDPATDQLDADTPEDVIVKTQARVPDFDPSLGITVKLDAIPGASTNKLVTIGDSVTMGFQSGAIYNTRISWPKIVAAELGCDPGFRFPLFDGYGGLPLNIEYLLRAIEHKYGTEISWWELPAAGFELRHQMALIEDYWERGAGAKAPVTSAIMHNLAVYGWDIRDALSRTAKNLKAAMVKPKDDLFSQVVENANIRAALGVYSSMDETDTLLDAARKLGEQGALPGSGGDATTPGIETLVVFLGANNVLGAVTRLKVNWSGKNHDKIGKDKDSYTVWRPIHFESEYLLLVAELEKIKAQHVILINVPHVTIAPVARGVAQKVEPRSRYFPFYTRPWISDSQFNAATDPNITENQARAIDSAIDQYNELIANVVKQQRLAGKDWYVLDIAGVMDRVAARRYINDVAARPAWWTEYELPAALKVLNPKPDSRFFSSSPQGRLQGGLFSLDGIHPTTITYGLIAQEVINIMQLAKVPFYHGDGVTLRQGPVQVDFERLIRLDSLISKPPATLSSDMKTLGWLDETGDFFGKLNPFS